MKIKSYLCAFFLLAVMLMMSGCVSATPGPVDFSSEFAVPKMLDASGLKFDFQVSGNIRPILFEGPEWKGNPSRVFAWYGTPAEGKGPYPAVVLVHGGGGSAFSEWVRRWNERGYAAIAIDTHGCVPISPWEGRNISKKNEGGAHADRFAPNDPVQDQWTYQAIAAVMRAHSLLRTFPEIDKDNIGVTGISWGGFLTLIAAGVDHRFKYAIPVYGCGFLNDPPSMCVMKIQGSTPEERNRWLDLWDPSNYCGNAKMPVFMVNDCDDPAFPMDHWTRTWKLLKNAPALFVDHTFGHSHHSGDQPEVLRFANAMTGRAAKPAELVSLKKDGRSIELEFTGGKAPFKADLVYTVEKLPADEKVYITRPYLAGHIRKWQTLPAEIKDGKITVVIPQDAVYSLVRLTDADGKISFLLD